MAGDGRQESALDQPVRHVKDLQASITLDVERFGFRPDFQGPRGGVCFGR
jgi:hypothetical protein